MGDDQKKKMIKIAAGVTASVVILAITAVLVWWFVFRKKPKAQNINSCQGEEVRSWAPTVALSNLDQ